MRHFKLSDGSELKGRKRLVDCWGIWVELQITISCLYAGYMVEEPTSGYWLDRATAKACLRHDKRLKRRGGVLIKSNVDVLRKT